MPRGRKKGDGRGRPSGKKELVEIIKVDNYEVKADTRQFILIDGARQTYHGSILSLVDSILERKLRAATKREINDLKNTIIDTKRELMNYFNNSKLNEVFRCKFNKEDE